MPSPVEDIVGQPYKPLIRFFVAATAIISVVMVSSDRAKGFVDERVQNKTQALETTVAGQKAQVEKMDTRLQAVQEDVAVIKEQVQQIREAVQPRRK